MLVLSRQRDETIMIGDDVEITIVDIRGDKVRLGINAPRSIQVHRKEVYDAIKRENQQAAKLNPRDVSEVANQDAEKSVLLSRSRGEATNGSQGKSQSADQVVPEHGSEDRRKLDDPQSTASADPSQ